MKKFMLIAFIAVFAMSCNNATTKENSTAAADTSSGKIDYAYLPANHPPDYWDRGDQKNIALVLKSLKGFETKNVEQALEPFADSVLWQVGNMDAKISKDSLRSMFTNDLKAIASIKIVMNDYESVISKDKKLEYVSLWYKQINTDMKGKVDSMICMDDAKIVNGKIVELEEKVRPLGQKK
ncbi:hypothetical protein LK994_05795 [Ferruginibacter lapsinanis]|uniref:hypothetical protein n=1 Tax=Ferruginibacter lapsinanis TaxID=563172 RepID=UPI001E405978|nr:hypothetical protein [Ferruginibacter lapsinanis]UEG50986.1 hypothetical protein LK994_05795 [Ferruginibacter lapsinanis]